MHKHSDQILFAVAIAASVAAAPVAAQGDPPPSVEAMQNEFTGYLKDPGSATFRNLRVVPHKVLANEFLLCGWVNARYSFGGYTGFEPFMVHFMNGHIKGAPMIADDPQTASFIAGSCD